MKSQSEFNAMLNALEGNLSARMGKFGKKYPHLCARLGLTHLLGNALSAKPGCTIMLSHVFDDAKHKNRLATVTAPLETPEDQEVMRRVRHPIDMTLRELNELSKAVLFFEEEGITILFDTLLSGIAYYRFVPR